MKSNPLAELDAIQWCRDKEITVNYIEKPGKVRLYFNGQLLMEGDTLRNAVDKVRRYSRVELSVKQEQKEGSTLEATSGYVQSGNEERREDMNIDPNYKRRIRIVGKLGETRGYALNVYDAETGEAITNVTRIELLLNVKERNEARVTYYELNGKGITIGEDGSPIIGTVVTPDPELDLTAWEVEGKQ